MLPKRKVIQISQLEHAKRKSMWVGSKKLQTIITYILSDNSTSFILEKINFAPAWFKIFDEIAVNALDHWVVHNKGKNAVTEIKFYFATQTGRITVFNDGPAIDVIETENLAGVKMYVPQMIASEFLSGDNLEEDENRTTGGTNGAGLKLTNAFSDELILITSDVKRKKHYTQIFKDRLEVIEPPTIRKTKKSDKSFTSIEFLPSYKTFGYKNGYDKKLAPDLIKLIKIRAYQSAVVTKADVYFNDEKIEIPIHPFSKQKGVLKTFENFAYMHLGEYAEYGVHTTTVLSSDEKQKELSWDVSIGVSDGKFRQVSLINGIWVSEGGTHIKHLQNLIVDALKSKVGKIIKKSKNKFNPNYILNSLFIFVKGSIVNPEFKSQIKDAIDDPIEKFEKYAFKKSDISKLWKVLEDPITFQFLNKTKDKDKKRVDRGYLNIPKCKDAKYAGHKKYALQTTMLVCEGDSAQGTVHDGIVHKSTKKLDYVYYGTFNIGGVPLNARKECTSIIDKKTNTPYIIRSKRLQDNERLSSLAKVLGLDYNKSYKRNDAGDLEFKTLRYGSLVAVVDQDDDGKGQIFGLLLNFFILFWPCLIERNYIKRFNTPIKRLYPKNMKNTVKEFYNDHEYESWAKDTFDGDEEKIKSMYRIKFYKGLGSHNKKEVPQMFKHLHNNERMFIYKLDSEAQDKAESYFGIDSNKRKVNLRTPVVKIPTTSTCFIDSTEQFDIDTKAFQRDNIVRKLPCLSDGLVPSRRKIMFTARQIFGSTKATNKEMKVNAFVNNVSARTNYHHGEASLATTAIKMGQDFPGAYNLPMLSPEGGFGTRSKNGKDYADPRYSFVKLNQRLCYAVFPKDDDFLLKYVFEEGNRCEPEYYVPIIPMALMENMSLPATGWKFECWARDYKSVFKNIRDRINDKIKKSKPLPIWLNNNKCDIRTYEGKDYCVGKYEYDHKKETLTITELPFGICSESYIGDLSSDKIKYFHNKPQFKSIPEDMTNDDSVNIVFQLTETGMDEIMQDKISKKNADGTPFNVIEIFMNLRASINHHINMIDIDGTIIEFKKYNKVFDAWFEIRKKLYTSRIDRMIIITNFMIKYLENIIKFTKNHQKYNITPRSKEDQVYSILKENKYDTFNHTLLISPKYSTVEYLQTHIMNGEGTTYNYLVNLRYTDMIEKACKKREEELRQQKLNLLDLKMDDGSVIMKGGKTWLSELEALECVIKEGLKKGWKYGEDNYKFE
jgi:DNA gyrase/topoisomerase IV subunit B